jgi:hypothetical protein
MNNPLSLFFKFKKTVMTQKTFEKYFSVKVLSRKKHAKPYDYLETIKIEVTDVRNQDKSTYIWNGSSLIINDGVLDMNYLDYLMSRGMGGGPDFVDIVEEYVMNELI